jgi:hypothetical protein
MENLSVIPETTVVMLQRRHPIDKSHFLLMLSVARPINSPKILRGSANSNPDTIP